MLATDRILALNIGASQVTLAEFAIRRNHAPTLLQYGTAELGLDPESEIDSSAYVVAAVRDLIHAKGFRPAPLLVSLSGQAVFPRFVKLPPVTGDKLFPMIQYEAEQNVPFAIAEVVWDYQLIGTAEEGEQNAMIVAVKTEHVASATESVSAAELEPEVIDVAPLSIINCVKHNYPDLDGCTMVVDIGARSTNLIFIEDWRVFYRSIPVAGNNISQEIAKTMQVDFRVAEKIKREKGFVALGGVYGSDDETAESVSKIARNVVARLHAEINRSINFYRQQGGTAPKQILLTGGTSILPNIDAFFREKLKLPVDFLNPFVNVGVGGRVNEERVGEDFFRLAEVTGLALRASIRCPVEINLVPPTLLKKKTFRRRIPWFVVSAAVIVAATFLTGVNANRQVGTFEARANEVASKLSELQGDRAALRKAAAEREEIVKDIDKYSALIRSRTVVAERLNAVKAALIEGMWLTSVESIPAGAEKTTGLNIKGRVFTDRAKAIQAAGNGKDTAVEILCAKLKAQPLFADAKIKSERNEGTKEQFCAFEIEVTLQDAE